MNVENIDSNFVEFFLCFQANIQNDVNKGPTRCNSMQTSIHCHVTLHVSGVTHPSSGVLRTVSATSGVCHGNGNGNGTVTSFHCGPIRTPESGSGHGRRK